MQETMEYFHGDEKVTAKLDWLLYIENNFQEWRWNKDISDRLRGESHTSRPALKEILKERLKMSRRKVRGVRNNERQWKVSMFK